MSIALDWNKSTAASRPAQRWRSRRQQVALRRGLTVSLTDRFFEDELNANCHGSDAVKIHFKLSGDSTIRFENGNDVPIRAGEIYLVVQPGSCFKTETIKPNSYERYVNLSCDQACARELFPTTVDYAYRPFVRFLDGKAIESSVISFPMQPQIKAAVERILEIEENCVARDLLIEARSLELLSYVVQILTSTPSRFDALRERDIRRVRELCGILDASGGLFTSISDLSRRVAWNESQMMTGFKAVTGSTISQYCHRLRMENAARMLRDTAATITEVALEVGYEHPANFATAFKRTFGYSPKQARSCRHVAGATNEL